MTEKFTIEDLFIRIIPGGVFISFLFFMYGDSLDLTQLKGMDILFTFLFFVFSFLLGELLQTLAHLIERVIYIFFRFYKPSEIFIFKNNPIINNENIRLKIVEYLSLSQKDPELCEMEYKQLPVFKKNKKVQKKVQSYFWQLYTDISSEKEIQIFNRSYLLIRAITFEFILMAVFLLIERNFSLVFVSLGIFLIFLWRARGMARMLVFKTVLINLKKHPQ